MKVRVLHIFIAAAGLLAVGILTMVITRIKTRTDANKITMPSIDDVPHEYWVKLAEKKIFFGHKSAGSNIIDGMEDISNECKQIKLNIVTILAPLAFTTKYYYLKKSCPSRFRIRSLP